MTGWLRIVVLVAVVALSFRAEAATPTTRPAGFRYVTVTTYLDDAGLPKKLVRREIYFIGDGAIVVDSDTMPEMHMDTRKQTASDEHGSRWTLADLQRRADHERDDLRKQLQQVKEDASVLRMKHELDPAFAFSEEGGKLLATNPVTRCEIETEPVDPQYRKRLYLAIKLNTYASASATSLPYVTLALTEELERRGSIIKDARIVTKAGGRESEVRIQSRITPLSDDDQKRLATLLLPAGGL